MTPRRTLTLPILFAALFLVVVVTAGFIIAPFIPALLWALTLSILTWPMYAKFKGRFERVKFIGDKAPTVAGIATVLSTFLIFVVPFALIGTGLFLQLKGIAGGPTGGEDRSISGLLEPIDRQLKPIATQLGAQNFSLVNYFEENRDSLMSQMRPAAANFARSGAITILTLVMALLSQFFMLRDSYRLKPWYLDVCPLPQDKAEELLKKLYETAWAVFYGTVLVAILQGSTIGVTYAALGVPNALILGVISILLCIIPLLGSPILYIPVAVWMATQGNLNGAIILLVIGLGIVSNIDNVLRPFIIGGRVNLHPLVIFFSILGGVVFFGPIGVMAGPMLYIILATLIDGLRIYMREEKEAAEHRSDPEVLTV